MELEERAKGQYGLFTLGQAIDSGIARATVYRRARLERYVLLHPGVFSFAGQPESWERSVSPPAWRPRRTPSHPIAARRCLWGLVDPSDGIVEITVPRSQRRRLPGVTVHQSVAFGSAHTTVRRRIPTTDPLRAMVELGAVLGPDGAEDALDAGLAWPALFSVMAVRATLDRLVGSGRRRGAQRGAGQPRAGRGRERLEARTADGRGPGALRPGGSAAVRTAA